MPAWFLVFVVTSGFMAPNSVNTIFGFTTLENCEFTRDQMVKKMDIKKSACVELRLTPPPASPDEPKQ